MATPIKPKPDPATLRTEARNRGFEIPDQATLYRGKDKTTELGDTITTHTWSKPGKPDADDDVTIATSTGNGKDPKPG